MRTESNMVGRSTLAGLPRVLARALLRRIAVNENVAHGQSFRVGRGVVISSPHGLQIGDFVSIGPRSIVQVDGTIGDFSLIGMGVQIVGRNDHAIDEVGRPFVLSTWAGARPAKPEDRVEIGRDVWIGGGSIVVSGTQIGEGALVGAGSVVTRDVPPYVIAAGNPARVIRQRFDLQQQQAHSAALDELHRSLLARA